MGEAIVAGIIVLASIASSLLTNKSNKDLIKQQQDWQEEMIDKQNEYNEPVNKIEREQEAGILRNSLATASGSLYSTNSAGPVGSGLLQMLDPMSNVANIYGSLMQGGLSNQQRKSAKDLFEAEKQSLLAQADEYKANVALIGANTRSVQIANEYADALAEIAVTKGKADIDFTYWQTKQVRQGVRNMEAELEKVWQEISESKSREGLNLLEQNKVLAEIETLATERQKMQAETSLLENESSLTQEKMTTEALQQSNIAAQTSSAMSSAAYTDEQNRLLSEQINQYLETYDDQVAIIANQAKLSKKEVRWYIVNSLLKGGSSAALGFGAAAAGVKAIGSAGAAAPAAGAAAAAATLPPVPF